MDEIEESNTPTLYFSDLTEDQLTHIFGEGLRLQLCRLHIVIDGDSCVRRDLNLFGTLQVAPDFSPDPLLQNAVFDVFNREFNHPTRAASSFGHGELRELIHTSFPVSSTSVVQIAAKLYVTTDLLDDVEEYIDDHDRRPTVVEAIFSIPRPQLSDEEKRKRREKVERDCAEDKLNLRRLTLQPRSTPRPRPRPEPEPEPDNEAFHVCDDHTFINISDMPRRCGKVRFRGKHGYLNLSYGVFKYAVDAHLELEFLPTSTLKNVIGRVFVYYPAYHRYITLFEDISSTTFITPGKMNLIRSVLAVPANSSFIIKARLSEYVGVGADILILSGTREFHVPCDLPSSEATIEGEKCKLKLKVNWKMPSEERKIPSSSNPSVSRLTERRKFGAHSTPTMADPDECNRWSLQEEIAKVFDTSLKRTFKLQEAVPCSISTCTREDGGDYLCSSVMNIWPEIKNACVYKGPKHAGLAVKDDIMGSDYKDVMERCVVCGPGFVKFKLCRKWIANRIHTMLTVGIETWAPKLSVKKVIIYFVSKRMAEDVDMGHLRSTFIIETLASMLEYSGVVVLRKRILDTVAGGPLYRRLYRLLGIDVKEDDISFYESYTREIIDLFREKGLPIGSEEDELPLVDLTVWWHALKEEKADWIVDVADVRERVHIERCFDAAIRAGLIANDHSKFPISHVGFGLVQGDDIERFRTFDTKVVNLLNLLGEAKSLCKALLERQAGMANEWTANELEHAAEALGYGAIKYADLKNNRLTNYTFSFNQMLNEEGNTAVYLQFTHIRICSIIKSSSKDIKGLIAEMLILKHDDERELGLHLLRFTEVLGEVCTILTPHILCDYLYGLCKKFNSLDSSVWQVVGSCEETSKLLLCKATEVVMRKCFDLLGITAIY